MLTPYSSHFMAVQLDVMVCIYLMKERRRWIIGISDCDMDAPSCIACRYPSARSRGNERVPLANNIAAWVVYTNVILLISMSHRQMHNACKRSVFKVMTNMGVSVFLHAIFFSDGL